MRCGAVGEGLFTAVALEMDPRTRIFITLPVVPVGLPQTNQSLKKPGQIRGI